MTPSARKSFNWKLHAFGVFVMLATAIACTAASIVFHDLWIAADDFGKGMLGGIFVGLITRGLLARMGKS